MPAEATTSAPPALRTITLSDGMTVAYRELGEGPAVLLLHGWPTSSFLWRRVMPAIAAHHRVLALDLPGFGASDKPADAGYGFSRFERAIDGFLAALDVEDTALAVHDLGGPIGVHWALANPRRVTKLALLNTLLYPEFDEMTLKFVVALSTPEERDRITSTVGLAEVMRLGVTDPDALGDDVLAAVSAPFATSDERLALAQAGIGLNPAGFEEIAEGLPGLNMPVRIIYGEDDRILPDVATTMERVKRDVPHAEVTALPGCGHFLQEEQPERVGDLLAAFFRA